MKATLRVLALALSALTAQAAIADTTVTVGATASSRDAAIEQALGDALVEALGSHVFSVTTMTGDQFSAMSTSVSAGRISDFTVLEEYETFEGVHVRVAVNLSDQDLAGLAPQEVDTWDKRIEDTQSLDMAQRTVGEYRRVLDEFLVGPRHQLNAGYAFVLRSYDVETVDTRSLKGNIYVDVTVNQSWWNTYYQLVDALTPQGNQVVLEGPVKVYRDAAMTSAAASSRVDRSLQYDLAHPLPVRLSVGTNVSKFILYKNALLVSAQPMTEDTAQTSFQVEQARRGEISMTKGNVDAGNASVDLNKSALDCGTVIQESAAVYCGNRFTIKIPYEAKSEAEIIQMMKEGLKAELNLFGSACENDCEIFQTESETALDPLKLLEEALRRGGQS